MSHDLSIPIPETLNPGLIEVKPPLDGDGGHCGGWSWPPERFYWAMCQATGVGAKRLHGKRLAESFAYQLESVVPGIAAEELHIVHAPLHSTSGSNANHIVCGIPRDLLRQELANANGISPLTLRPSSLPSFIAQEIRDGFDSSVLNLLTGGFVPPQVGAARRSRNAWTLCLAATLAILFSLGLHLRTQQLRSQISVLKTREAQVLASVVPPTAPSAVAQPLHLRLTAELRMLEQTRGSQNVRDLSPRDVSLDLAALLAAWPPPQLRTQTDSMVITDSAMTVRGRVPAMSDAQQWVDALQAIEGWTARQPQTSTGSSGSIETTIALTPHPPTNSSSSGSVGTSNTLARGGS